MFIQFTPLQKDTVSEDILKKKTQPQSYESRDLNLKSYSFGGAEERGFSL